MDGSYLGTCSVLGRQELCQNTGKLQVVRVEWGRVRVLEVLPVLGEAVCLSSALLWQSWCHEPAE